MQQVIIPQVTTIMAQIISLGERRRQGHLLILEIHTGAEVNLSSIVETGSKNMSNTTSETGGPKDNKDTQG